MVWSVAGDARYPDLVIVGAGLFGLTVAQQAVEHTGACVRIIDIRDHIGGNAYSYAVGDGLGCGLEVGDGS